MKKKILLASIVALSLALLVAVGGTVAWLIDTDGSAVNTFTPSDVDITLTETYNVDSNNDSTTDAWMKQMIPGNVLEKDPKVKVETETNVAIWLYVEITESANLDSYIAYAIASGWNLLGGTVGETINTDTNDGTYVIYREVTTSGETYDILGAGSYTGSGYTVTWGANHVGVKPEVTKSMMKDLTSYPTLTFTAYAIQQANTGTAEQAWYKIKPST